MSSTRYRVERVLSAGGSAEIALATELESGRRVVLKRLLPELAGDFFAEARLRAEAELTHALAHPGIARVLDLGSGAEPAYFAMEYIPGRTLRERPPSSLDETIAIGAALCSVLDHVHRAGVVHRDVSPDNVMIAPDRVVLLDFGVARARGDGAALPSGVALGTLAYASPEQLCGAPIDGGSDVFSLGALLWELVTGKRLFWRDHAAATLLAVTEAPIPRVSEHAANVPERVERALAGALERDPKLRPSAAELAALLTAP